MKKILSLALTLFVMLGSLGLFAQAEENVNSEAISSKEVLNESEQNDEVPVMNTYYVAVDGSDENPGTIEEPFATLEAAKAAIRKQKEAHGLPKGGICVYIREGTYSQLEPFVLDEKDAGTKEAPITYRAYKNESVKFVGGVQLQVKDFKRVSDKAVLNRLYNSDAREFIYQYDLSDIPGFEAAPVRYPGAFTYEKLRNAVPVQGNELVCDDEIMNIARWPNVSDDDGGYAGIAEVLYTTAEPEEGFKFTISDSARVKNWANSLDDMIIYGLWSNGWWDSAMNIASVTDGVITTTHRADRFSGPVKDYAMFYVFNLIEELDEPGEFFIDGENKILYFYPPENSTRNSVIYLSTLGETMFQLKDTSYITIRGLEIQATRHTAFQVEGGEENLIAYNEIKNIGGYAAAIKSGYHNGAVGNHVIRADGGFSLGGGDMFTLTRAENYLENNHVEDFTRITKTYRGAMTVSGVGNRMSHNEMNNGQHLAMQFADCYNVIEFNEIYDVLQDVDDSGSIYGGASWVWRRNEIRNNYFHDFTGGDMTHGNACVYFDDNLANGIVTGNIFLNVNGRGIQSTGWDQNWQNNIFIDVRQPLSLKTYHAEFSEPLYADDEYYIDYGKHYNLFNTYPWNEELWLSHFPEMEGWDKKDMRFSERATIRNNVMVNCGVNDIHDQVYENALSIENNITMDDPGFMDMKNRDFRLKENAAVYSALPEFKDVQFEKMGRYDDYIKEAIKNTVVLSVDKAGAYVKGEKTQVDTENDMVFPIVENSRTLVPVRFISEAFNADVKWDEQSQKVTVNLDGKAIEMQMDSNILKVNGNETIMDATPVMHEDRVLIPLRALVEALGKQVFWDDKGLIIIGENPYVLDSIDDQYCIDELIRQCNLR